MKNRSLVWSVVWFIKSNTVNLGLLVVAMTMALFAGRVSASPEDYLHYVCSADDGDNAVISATKDLSFIKYPCFMGECVGMSIVFLVKGDGMRVFALGKDEDMSIITGKIIKHNDFAWTLEYTNHFGFRLIESFVLDRNRQIKNYFSHITLPDKSFHRNDFTCLRLQ